MLQFQDFIGLLIYANSIRCNQATLNIFVNFLNSNADTLYLIDHFVTIP